MDFNKNMDFCRTVDKTLIFNEDINFKQTLVEKLNLGRTTLILFKHYLKSVILRENEFQSSNCRKFEFQASSKVFFFE